MKTKSRTIAQRLSTLEQNFAFIMQKAEERLQPQTHKVEIQEGDVLSPSRIKLIKLRRDLTGASLKDAKDFVDLQYDNLISCIKNFMSRK